MNADDRAALEAELRDLEFQIERLRDEVRGVADDLREGDEAGSSRIAVEELTLIENLERRRAELQSELFGTDVRDEIDTPAVPGDTPLANAGELTESDDVDDEVEALEVSAMSAATEDDQHSDATELADRAAPPAAEDDLTRAARTSADLDHLEVGLAPGADLDVLEDASLETLIEAQLAAVDEADPETAAIIKDEIDRRQDRG